MKYIIDEAQIQALTIRVLSGDLRGVIEGVKTHIEGLRQQPIPQGSKLLTPEQVSEAISLGYMWGNDAIVNYLFHENT